MLRLNVTLPTNVVAASAADGIAAVTNKSVFALQGQLDNNRTIRSNAVVGDLSIAHSQTKEFAGAGKRHLVRIDLKANGTLPGAYAYLVLGHPDSSTAPARALEAYNLLRSALIVLSDNMESVDVITDLAAVNGAIPEEDNGFLTAAATRDTVSRLTAGEG